MRKKIRKWLSCILLVILCAGMYGTEIRASEMETFLDPIPIYRLTVTNGKETLQYTAFYMKDANDYIYLLSSAFVGAAIEDGWTATLHTASGTKRVSHILSENGVAYLKSEIPENVYFLEMSDDTEMEGGRLFCSRKTEKKIENTDDFIITNYTWKQLKVDFSTWHHENGYYLDEEHYIAEAYLKEDKSYGAPLFNIYQNDIHLIGTLYMDEYYRMVIRDFRITGLDERGALGKADTRDWMLNEISNDLLSQLDSMEYLLNEDFFVNAALEETQSAEQTREFTPVWAAGVVILAGITAAVIKRKK